MIEDNITINEKGRPVCQAGHEMTYNGYDKSRHRHKYRCPFKTGKIDGSDCQEKCFPSPYGRAFYLKSSDDPRYESKILFKTKKWKGIYKNRSSTERVNKRVLDDYPVHVQ